MSGENIKRRWGVLEANAAHEMHLALCARTNVEREEHVANADTAELAATYLHAQYEGEYYEQFTDL